MGTAHRVARWPIRGCRRRLRCAVGTSADRAQRTKSDGRPGTREGDCLDSTNNNPVNWWKMRTEPPLDPTAGPAGWAGALSCSRS